MIDRAVEPPLEVRKIVRVAVDAATEHHSGLVAGPLKLNRHRGAAQQKLRLFGVRRCRYQRQRDATSRFRKAARSIPVTMACLGRYVAERLQTPNPTSPSTPKPS
jgi:hypothetical protein